MRAEPRGSALNKKNDAVAKWPNAAVCKTAIRGFDSRLRLLFTKLDFVIEPPAGFFAKGNLLELSNPARVMEW